MYHVTRLVVRSIGVLLLLECIFRDPEFDRRGTSFTFHADAALRVPGLLERDHAFVRVREGDISIGLLASVHETNDNRCSDVQPSGVIRAWAMEYAVDQVNARLDLLPNITLGFVQMDDCWNDLKALEVAVYFAANDECPGSMSGDCNSGASDRDCTLYRSYHVVGVLGPSNSAMSMAVSQFFGTFHIPVLSLYATNNALSDKTEYPYFMRLVPPNIRQEQLVLEVCLTKKPS
jgi:hypothetical protein